MAAQVGAQCLVDRLLVGETVRKFLLDGQVDDGSMAAAVVFRAAWSGVAAQQAFEAEVLVEVRPVNAFSIAKQTPVLPLSRTGSQQPGIPLQGKR